MNGIGDIRLLFISGGTGHTGSRVARRLAEEGQSLRCLLHTAGRREYLPDYPNVEIVTGDLQDVATIEGALKGADAFLHLAHIGFAPRVVEACRRAGIRRLIALSSTRRFTRFQDATAERVIAGETAIENSGLDYTILRSSMIYGDERDDNLEKLARWLRKRRWMPLVAGGRNLVQPIFVDDLVEAITRALTRPEATRRRSLTVAGPEAVTQRDLVETLGRALGRPPIWIPAPQSMLSAAAAILEIVHPRPPMTRAQVRRLLEDKAFDISEAREALGGWAPRGLDEGVELKVGGNAECGAAEDE